MKGKENDKEEPCANLNLEKHLNIPLNSTTVEAELESSDTVFAELENSRC